MTNLAAKIEQSSYKSATAIAGSQAGREDACATCGATLFDGEIAYGSWQVWSAFWEIPGMTSVELVCGRLRRKSPNILQR